MNITGAERSSGCFVIPSQSEKVECLLQPASLLLWDLVEFTGGCFLFYFVFILPSSM